MSQSLNDAADGLEAIVEAIDSTIAFSPEPNELASPATVAGIYGEVFFSGLKATNPADQVFEVVAEIELSTPADVDGWSAAVRRIRTLTSPFGSGSVMTAIRADKTLGGRVSSCLVAPGSLGAETLKGFQDGNRWTAPRLRFIVRLTA
jgi:hypothetical protein